MTPAETVLQFISALEAKDLDAALALVTDDVELDNVPMGKVLGPAGIRELLEPFLGSCQEIDWVIHHQVAQGNTVMNERNDRFLMGDRWVEVAVAGLFVLRDEKIALWRDYFDLGMFERAMAG